MVDVDICCIIGRCGESAYKRFLEYVCGIVGKDLAVKVIITVKRFFCGLKLNIYGYIVICYLKVVRCRKIAVKLRSIQIIAR